MFLNYTNVVVREGKITDFSNLKNSQIKKIVECCINLCIYMNMCVYAYLCVFLYIYCAKQK